MKIRAIGPMMIVAMIALGGLGTMTGCHHLHRDFHEYRGKRHHRNDDTHRRSYRRHDNGRHRGWYKN
jgi:hypothetical protein